MIYHSNGSYTGRRSAVFSLGGMVATSQPAATQAGVRILCEGGTAADAAVAAAAALGVTQPCSTGLGGDAFCLYYSAEDSTVYALNGSGRAPGALSIDRIRSEGHQGSLPPFHAHTVTVPGAAAAWEQTVHRFGKLPLERVLAPAIHLAERGYPVAPLTSMWWAAGVKRQLSTTRHGHELTIDRRAPKPGEAFRNPNLAWVLRELATGGSDAFYRGAIAERIVEAVGEAGGVLSVDDLARHRGEWVTPISIDYRGIRVWECPPNGQGIAALIALNIFRNFEPSDFSDAQRVHLLVEAMRLAFADSAYCVADPEEVSIPVGELLSARYGAQRAGLIDPNSAMKVARPGDPAVSMYPHTHREAPGSGPVGDDTVYLAVTDRNGNGCSFINSNFMGFGTGIVPGGCGFSLQNRGFGFVLDENHPNALRPGRRPYHTIIPALATRVDTSGLYSVLGVMGGMMQPQGHLQVASALVDREMDPQAALDRSRFQLDGGAANGSVDVEESPNDELANSLSELGHEVRAVRGVERYRFGLGQVICATESGYVAGSDSRGDGCALADDLNDRFGG